MDIYKKLIALSEKHKRSTYVAQLAYVIFLVYDEISSIPDASQEEFILACIVISSKYIDSLDSYLWVKDVVDDSLRRFRDVCYCEKRILQRLEWDIHRIYKTTFLHDDAHMESDS